MQNFNTSDDTYIHIYIYIYQFIIYITKLIAQYIMCKMSFQNTDQYMYFVKYHLTINFVI